MNDDYAFYDTGALAAAAATSSNNNWAGASHWKFVGVKKKVARFWDFLFFFGLLFLFSRESTFVRK